MEIERVKLDRGRYVDIPVGPDGYVPEEVLISHFRRNVKEHEKDYDDHATVVLPSKVTPREAASWWLKPNRTDIMYIDTAGVPQYDVSGMSPKEKEVHKKIGIVGPPNMEKNIRKMLNETYSFEELEKMTKDKELTIQVRPIKGSYGDIRGSRIRLDTFSGVEESTIVHEGTHLLRRVDNDRKNPLTKFAIDLPVRESRPDIKLLKRQCVEESCTVAEQMARSKDPKTGYYYLVKIYDKTQKKWRYPTEEEAEKMRREDRKLFTRGTGKPLSAKEAIKSVEENWSKSHIANLDMGPAVGSAINIVQGLETPGNISLKNITPSAGKKRARSPKKSTVKRSTAKKRSSRDISPAAGKKIAMKQNKKKTVKKTGVSKKRVVKKLMKDITPSAARSMAKSLNKKKPAVKKSSSKKRVTNRRRKRM